MVLDPKPNSWNMVLNKMIWGGREGIVELCSLLASKWESLIVI